jgi:hypothetical protein
MPFYWTRLYFQALFFERSLINTQRISFKFCWLLISASPVAFVLSAYADIANCSAFVLQFSVTFLLASACVLPFSAIVLPFSAVVLQASGSGTS